MSISKELKMWDTVPQIDMEPLQANCLWHATNSIAKREELQAQLDKLLDEAEESI